jgi:hypothetical protein
MAEKNIRTTTGPQDPNDAEGGATPLGAAKSTPFVPAVLSLNTIICQDRLWTNATNLIQKVFAQAGLRRVMSSRSLRCRYLNAEPSERTTVVDYCTVCVKPV